MLELHYGYNERVMEHQRLKRVRESEEKYGPDQDPKPDLRFGGDTDEIDGLTYELVVEFDDYPTGEPGHDDEVLGTLTSYPEKQSSWKIDPDEARRILGYYSEDAELWWNPMQEIWEYDAHLRKAGASKQVARELALADEKKMRDRRLSYGDSWEYFAVGVIVSFGDKELGSAYIAGVESDFVATGYVEDLVPDLVCNALEEAKDNRGRVALEQLRNPQHGEGEAMEVTINVHTEEDIDTIVAALKAAAEQESLRGQNEDAEVLYVAAAQMVEHIPEERR